MAYLRARQSGLRAVKSLRQRNRELTSTLAECVDAGWANGLAEALEEIAAGVRDPQNRALVALDRAGLSHHYVQTTLVS